jgi:hypothetical protein
MNGFVRDLQYGLRTLGKNPGYASIAVLTLALGVGANTAIFGVLRAVVLRDLPYHDASRIAVLWTKNIRQNLPDGSSYLNFRDWKTRSRRFEQMAAYMRPEFTRDTVGTGPDAERIHAGQVGPCARGNGAGPLWRVRAEADAGDVSLRNERDGSRHHRGGRVSADRRHDRGMSRARRSRGAHRSRRGVAKRMNLSFPSGP